MNTERIRAAINALESLEGASERARQARADLNKAEAVWNSLPVRARNIIAIGAALVGVVVGAILF